ncbi:MAG: hypothetical protein ACYCPF_21700, partial [Streptosporangiaceae bacterium]
MTMPDLIPLLYRADWTRWSLRADLVTTTNGAVADRLAEAAAASLRRDTAGIWPPPGVTFHRAGASAAGRRRKHGARIVIAPGGRFRYQPIGQAPPADDGEPADEAITLVVCDGRHCYVVRGDEAERFATGSTPIDRVIYPARLLSAFDLSVVGPATFAERDAIEVTGRPRNWAPAWADLPLTRLNRVDLLIDAELGVVLRSVTVFEGDIAWVTELAALSVGPAASDPLLFAIPPGTVVAEADRVISDFDLDPAPTDDGQAAETSGGGMAVGLAAAAGSGAAYIAARRLARPAPPRMAGADPLAAMPPPTGEPDGPLAPLDDDLLTLIVGGRPGRLSAQAHRWIDASATLRVLRAMDLARTGDDHQKILLGLLGAGSVWTVRTGHRAARILIAGTDRYRIGY